jgi:hypothetical protein
MRDTEIQLEEKYKLDANGNVIGGVRTPEIDAPIAAQGSQGNSGASASFSAPPSRTARLTSPASPRRMASSSQPGPVRFIGTRLQGSFSGDDEGRQS